MKVFKITILTICLFSFISCEKTDTPEVDIHMLYGDYSLSDIRWYDQPVDLNNDGVGNNNLLSEFQNKFGYYEPDYHAIVTDGTKYVETNSESVTAFNVSIPYPYYIVDDGIWECTEIRTFKITIRATKGSFYLHSNCCQIYPGFNDPTDVFLSCVKEISIVVHSYDDQKFKVGLHCTIPDNCGTDQKLNENYLYYEYTKK